MLGPKKGRSDFETPDLEQFKKHILSRCDHPSEARNHLKRTLRAPAEGPLHQEAVHVSLSSCR